MTKVSEYGADRVVQRYLRSAQRNGEIAESTAKNREGWYRLYFIPWFDQSDCQYMSDLDALVLDDWRDWLESNHELKKTSIWTYVSAVRSLIQYAEGNNLVKQELDESSGLTLPKIGPDEWVDKVKLEEDRGHQILAYLEEYDRYSRKHVEFALLWDTGFRTGTLRSIDLADIHPEADPPHIELHDRPEIGLPLKNDKRSERTVTMGESLYKVIEGYVRIKREKKYDDYGNEPLLTTCHGRISKQTLRNDAYKLTCPTVTPVPNGGGCDCTACSDGIDKQRPSPCIQTRSPHQIRGGYITKERNDETPPEALSHRCDTSIKRINEVYDRADPLEEARRHAEEFMDGDY